MLLRRKAGRWSRCPRCVARARAVIGAEVRAVRTEFSESFAAGHAVGVDLATEWSSAGDGQYASVVETLTVDDGQTDGPFEAGARCKVYEAV